MAKGDNKRFGTGFERRVMAAFESNGFVLLRRNQWKRNYDFEADDAKKREYDLVFFNPADNAVYIVECKAHFKKVTLTGLEELVEFAHKLKNYNGSNARGLMVTNTDYTGPARRFAKDSGITAINGSCLAELEARGCLSKKIASKVYGAAIGGFEGLLDEALSRYL